MRYSFTNQNIPVGAAQKSFFTKQNKDTVKTNPETILLKEKGRERERERERER